VLVVISPLKPATSSSFHPLLTVTPVTDYSRCMSDLQEAQLLPIITNNIDTFGQDLHNVRELSSGHGIADVVFYKLNSAEVKNRVDNKLNPIESFDLIRTLTQLNHLKESRINITLLRKAFPTLKNNEVLTFLIDHGFLVPQDSGYSEFNIGHQYQIGLQEVVAIEAKLSNWQRGLYQAYRYRQYANKSFLALYTKYIHRALNHIEEFMRFNVGLIEVGDETITVHFDPDHEVIKENVHSALVYERLLSRQENLFPIL